MPDNPLDAYLDPAPRTPRSRAPKDPLDLIAYHESGGRNIHQNVVPPGGGYNPSVGRVTGPSSAQGPWQITNTTWRRYAPRAGAGQFKSAMEAPVEIQRKVAQTIFNSEGYAPWAPYNPRLRAALRRGEGSQQKPTSDLDSYLDPPSSGQTPPIGTQSPNPPPAPPAPARQSPAPSVPARSRYGGIFTRPEVQRAVESAPVVAGNTDLSNRPRVRNRDGSISTVRSISVNIDGREVLLPTVSDDGRILSQRQAVEQYKRTGKHLGIFTTPTAATAYAKQLHEQQARQLTQGQGSSGIGELRRLDDSAVRQILEQQRQQPQDTALARYGVPQAERQRIARTQQREQTEDIAREQREAPELARLTDNYRKQIRTAQNRGIGPEQWLNEAAAKGVAGLMELGASTVRGAGYNPLAVGATDAADKIALHARALQQAAEAEGADRNVVSRTVQDVLAGAVSTAPELAAMSVGVPPIATFAVGGGARAYGRGERLPGVAKAATHGAATGAAFELPIPSGITSTVGRVAAKGATVGGATGAIELASGATPQEAASAAITNALFGAHGELKRGVTPRRVEEVVANVPESLRDTPEVKWLIYKAREDVRRAVKERYGEGQAETQPDVPAQRAAVERQLAERGAGEGVAENIPETLRRDIVGESRAADLRGAEERPARFYHRDYGEVTESPDQRRVGKGRVRVVTEDGTPHVIKRAALTGAGNQRAVPIRPESSEEPAQSTIASTIKKTVDRMEGDTRVVEYVLPQKDGPAIGVLLTIRPNGQAQPLIGPIEEGFGITTGGGKARLGTDTVLELKRYIQQQHPEITSINFEREGSTGGEFGRRRTITKPRATSLSSTASEIDRAQDFQGRKHTVTQALADHPLRDTVLKELPAGSVLAGPNAEAPEMQFGPIRLRAPDGEIWEVDLAYDHRKDADWKTIGTWQDGFALRKTGETVESAGAPPIRPLEVVELSSGARYEWRDGDWYREGGYGKPARDAQTLNAIEVQRLIDSRPPAEPPGNQRAVPIREPQAEQGIEQYLEPKSSTVPVVEAKEVGVTSRPEQPVPSTLESTTSARKAQLTEDRTALDLPELPAPERKSWQRSLDEARPERATLLADEVLTKPRALNDSETASLVVRAQQIKNEHAAKMREIGETSDSGTITQRRNEVEALEREFDRLTQATKASGTEKGRTLAAQKLTINQDYDLVSLVQRAKVAKGRDLTPAERTRYEQQATRIAELEQQLQQAETRVAERQIDNEIKRVSSQRRRAESREALDTEYAELQSQLAQIKAATTEGFFRSERGELDPEATKIVAKMARNRIRAGVTDAATLVSDIYATVRQSQPAATERDVRDAISGYGRTPQPRQQSAEAQELRRVQAELKRLSATEDIAAGTRLSPADARRQTQLRKREAELSAKLAAADFQRPLKRERPRYTAETVRLENQVNELKAKFDWELHRAQRGAFGHAWDVAVNVANIPKTLKSMGDISALLRQGGFYSATHPVLSARAAADMFRSFSEVGFKNVEHAIKTHPDFQLAKRSGVEFTGVDKESIPLSSREEAFLSNVVSKLPIAKQSEQTFVAFLDSQRMRVFEQFAGELRSRGLTPESHPAEYRAVAKLINIGTGRGSLGKRGNQIAPALNVLMFSPRLLASRVQLMNKMVNPVAIARMPPAARSRMVKDNVKFAATIATALGLAAAAGARVSTDPDDADFLKIRIGNSHYDVLTGLQQPMRFIYRMARAVQADITGDETYAGQEKAPILSRFARSKASPIAGVVTDYLTGEDFQGKKFKLSRSALDLLVPLYVDDFREAMKEYGPAQALVRTAPSVVGVGAQTYKDSPEKPRTHAEKLARKKVISKLPDEAREDEQIDLDQQKADLRARARRGEDVRADLAALGGKLTSRQVKGILAARNKTRLQEDVTRLGIKDALLVYEVATPTQREELKSIVAKKAPLANVLQPDEQQRVRAKLVEFGLGGNRPLRPVRITRPIRATP